MQHRIVAIVAVTVIGCAPKFDTDRDEAPGTFGERVSTLMCKRLAFSADRTDVTGSTYRDTCDDGTPPDPGAPPTVATITADRPRLAAGIDFAVPPDQTGPLQSFLTTDAVLGMYDDDTMSTSVKSLSDLLALVGSAGDAMDSLARLGGHRGYRSPATAIGSNNALLNARSIDGVLDTVLPAIDDGGAANAQFDDLLVAAGATFADASVPDEPVASRLSTLLDGLLLSERADLAETTPQYVVRRDRRGVAMVALDNNEVPPPFVDADGDHLADVDANGRFVDLAGMPLVVATPFLAKGDTAMRDAGGRALDVQGAPLYVYLDLGKTVFGAISHDTKKLVDPSNSTIIDFVRGAGLLMGDRVAATRTFDNGATLDYTGYDVTKSPLLDMAYGYTTLLGDPNIANVLALAIQLFSPAHVATTARLAENAIATARLADAHTEAQILPTAPLWDDLRPILARIAAKPKLMSDILDALKDPQTKLVADRFREFMEYSDRFDIDDATQTVTGSLTTKPDRTKPDSAFNRSLFQRLAMVIADSNVAQCNKQNAQLFIPGTALAIGTYDACKLFSIPNLAVFYLQSIVYNKDANGNYICESDAGAFGSTQTRPTAAACATIGNGWRVQRKASFNYQWTSCGVTCALIPTLLGAQGGDKFLATQATIAGFWTHPTPEALDRVLFLPTTPKTISDTADPIVDRDGDLMKTKHAGTLPVWEKNNFFDEIRPLAQAFADAGEEQTFVDILTVLHEHWSSAASTTTQHSAPAGKNYTSGANAVSYEPFIVEELGTDLWPALTDSAPELTAIVVNGKKFSDVLTPSMAYLTTPKAGLADRQGRVTSTTSDGKAVTTLTPWQILADAYVAKRARLATLGDAAKEWTDSGPELVDILFRGAKGGDGTWAFTNPRLAPITIAITQYIADRIAAHDTAGDRATWLATTLPADMADKLTHPVFAAVVDFLDELAREGAPMTALETLLAEVFDETGSPGAFATMRASNADLIQLAKDDQDLVPLGHLIGQILAPSQTFVQTQVAFLRKLHGADNAHTLRDITGRMFAEYDPGDDPGVPAISAIVDGAGDVDRVAPSTEPVWSAADYAAVFANVSAFLAEQQYGLPRFIAIVKDRKLPR